MSKSKWAPDYYLKKEILCLDSNEIVNAFERAVINITIMENCRARVSQKAVRELEWIKNELLTRLK